jgi:hypothetical protein
MDVAYFFVFGWRLIFHDLAANFSTSIVGYSDLYQKFDVVLKFLPDFCE